MKRDETPDEQPAFQFDGSLDDELYGDSDAGPKAVDDARPAKVEDLEPSPGGFVLDCTPIDYANPEPYLKAQREAFRSLRRIARTDREPPAQ